MELKRVVVLALLWTLVPAAAARAQVAGAVAGVVRDTTGAVLAGVTVEASSPALIEKVRAAVSDSTGQYRIADLTPGTYTVTFSLAGFSSLKREGIELTAGFTAPVNADLAIGDIAETITVSGASPVVDVQNVAQRAVLTRELMDTLPAGKVYSNLAQVIPGMYVRASSNQGSFDVGGAGGFDAAFLFIHGGRGGDMQILVDAMPTNIFEGPSLAVPPSDGSIEETGVALSAHTAESETGGVNVNFIGKSGGNAFSGTAFGNLANDRMQWRNVSPKQQAAGVPIKNGIYFISDFSPAFGGPIRQDRLWFYTTYKIARVERQSSMFKDTNTADWVYTPDVTRDPVADIRPQDDATGRLTWQLTQRNKISANLQYGRVERCCNFIGGVVTEEGSERVTFWSTPKLSASWTVPVTNQLLIETSGQSLFQEYRPQPAGNAVFPGAVEQSTGFRFRMSTRRGNAMFGSTYYQSYMLKSSVAYVTGRHAFKVGAQFWHGREKMDLNGGNGPYFVTLLNAVPRSVTYQPEPLVARDTFLKAGIYVQDQWTVKRMTVNAGVRFDSIDAGYPAQQLQATSILPARQFPKADVLAWRDVSPRIGVSYDLFGNNRTAVKASASRYVLQESTGTTRGVNPAYSTAQGSLTRTWTDGNGDFVPQGDPLNPLANGEIGPSTNANFGKGVPTTRFDPSAVRGWGIRPFQWEFSAAVQQELRPNVSANFGYFRRVYGGFLQTDNAAVAPSDYDHYCITTPADLRLPGGGGQQICGLYDITPAKVSAVDNVRRLASDFGKQTEHYDGVDLTLNARLVGLQLQGGVSTGRHFTDNCDVVTKVDNPSTLYCHSSTPYLTQFKLVGSYTLPWSLQASAVYQSVPGTAVPNPGGPSFGSRADYVATNAVIAPSLGRNLAGAANVTINIIPPGSLYSDRVHQLDLRVARSTRVGRLRIKGMVDFYNSLNSNAVIDWNATYGTTGAAWLQPRTVLVPRFVKVGMQLDF